jgi:hypothetical protein
VTLKNWQVVDQKYRDDECWRQFIKSTNWSRGERRGYHDIVIKNDKTSYEEEKLLAGKST